MKILSALGVVCVLGLAAMAQAAPITTLYNTGVDNSGGLLAAGSADPHWSWLSEPAGAVTTGPYVTTPGSFNFSNGSNTWIADTATSQWLSPQPEYSHSPAVPNTDPPGTYSYTTTFSLNGLDLSTAVISGQFAVDDTTTELLVNSQVVTIAAGGYTAFTSFSIPTSVLLPGTNTIEWINNNKVLTSNDPTGLQVNFTTATANPLAPVPLPAALAIFPLGATLAGWRWRMIRGRRAAC